MIIKNMFSKPIDRDIKGVIKVGQDDDANIKQELEEYVVKENFRNIFLIFLQATREELPEIRTRWVCGFRASLEVVNLTF